MPGLTPEQLHRFHEEGYLFVEGFLEPAKLEAVKGEIEAFIDRAARDLAREGEIEELHEGEGLETRLAKLVEQSAGASRILFSPDFGGPEYFSLLRHRRVLDAAESIFGPEVFCHPAHRVRAKLPRHVAKGGLRTVPWHQDSGYFAPECDDHLIVTVWIALTESTEENGCLEVVPGVHDRGLLRHQNPRGATWVEIPELMHGGVESVLLPARPGDAILLTNLTPHRSGPNRTKKVRWNVDCRFHHPETPTGAPSRRGFLTRSRERPEEVVTSFDELDRIRHIQKPRPKRWHRWEVVEPEMPAG